MNVCFESTSGPSEKHVSSSHKLRNKNNYMSSRFAFNFYIKNYMSLCYSKPSHNKKVFIQYPTTF